MSWYDQKEQGAHAAHVLYTSTVFSRNISNIPFLPSSDRGDISELIIKIGNVLETKGFCVSTSDGKSSAALRSYTEKHFVDPGCISVAAPYAVYFNDPCNLSVTIGGKDMLTINSTFAGLEASKSISSAYEAERMLDAHFDFSFSEKLGYLSPVPSHIGSGMRIRSLLFLPALVANDKIDKTASDLLSCGLDLHPLLCGAYPGNLFTLTYSVPQNTDRNAAAVYFSGMVEHLISEECQCEREMFSDDPILSENRARRARAIMAESISVSEAELLTLISDLRFFIANTQDSSKMPFSVGDLNYLLCESLNGSLALRTQRSLSGLREFNIERATYLRQYISGLSRTA